MPINWQDKAVQDRLLTAVIASVDNKVRKPENALKDFPLIHPQISIAEIARLYGEDMTYHAVKNYLRKFRKEAKEMKGDVVDRPGPVPSPAKPRAKKTSTVSPVKAGK